METAKHIVRRASADIVSLLSFHMEYRTHLAVALFLGSHAPPGCQTPVRVATKRDRFMSIKQKTSLFNSSGCLSTNGIVQCQRKRPFTIHVATLTKNPCVSRKGKMLLTPRCTRHKWRPLSSLSVKTSAWSCLPPVPHDDGCPKCVK